MSNTRMILVKLALAVALAVAFVTSRTMLAQAPPPEDFGGCGDTCSGSCSSNGGNCCAFFDNKCQCVAVNSGC